MISHVDDLNFHFIVKWGANDNLTEMKSSSISRMEFRFENLTDKGENVQKWTRIFSTRRWVILVARKRRKKEKKIACPPLDVFACRQVPSLRLYRLTSQMKFFKFNAVGRESRVKAAVKSIWLRTLFLNQLQNFSLFCSNLFLQPFFRSKLKKHWNEIIFFDCRLP